MRGAAREAGEEADGAGAADEGVRERGERVRRHVRAERPADGAAEGEGRGQLQADGRGWKL